MNGTLASGFLRNAERHPDRIAVEVADEAIPYAELADQARSWAATLGPHDAPCTAVLAARSRTAVAGILAALLRGDAYVPLHPGFPAERLVDMLERSRADTVIVDAEGAGKLPALLERIERPLTLLVPDGDVDGLRRAHPRHRWIDELAPASAWIAPKVPADSVAYLLFTSGSTGRPKGVMVSHANVRHFIDVMVERYQLGPDDRFSQTFELVFDLSVFDHFCAWEVGATVVIPTRAELLMPARYVALKELTVWFSVPSLGQLMRRLRMLAPGFYPRLRWVLFCGEALPASVAAAFAEAAPNATVENLYGPTEVTLACTLYRWDPTHSPDECLHGSVPIGQAYPGLQTRVVAADGHQVQVGEQGELVLCGPQVCPGYWRDPERTAQAFVTLPDVAGRWYRTGDRVVRPTDDEPLRYLGRVDHQVQVHGYRVELGEVEAVIEESTGVQAVVVPWPVREGTVEGLVAFVLAEVAPSALEHRLPTYMMPDAFRIVSSFPLNTNGKIDRKALTKRLEDET